MGNEIALAIPIAPEPKARPRFAVVHGHVETYTPKKTKSYENFVAAFYKAAAKGFKFEKGIPLTVTILFAMEIPTSKTKKVKNQMADGNIKHTVKPDLDNLVKSILDGLNGIAWHDDAQIVQLNVSKSYSESPHIFITIRETT